MGRSGYYANQPVVGAVTARLLMLALARGGNFAEALHVYERLRGLLRAELGIAPSAGMREFHASLLQAGADSRTAK